MKKVMAKCMTLVLALVFMVVTMNIGASPVSITLAEEPDAFNLKIMTFNIRNLHGDDGTANSWDNRKGIAVNAINSFGPQVMGLQEAYLEQINYFLSNLGASYSYIGKSRFGNTTDEYQCIFYRSDLFRVLDQGQFWLSETPDAAGSKSSYDSSWPRSCTWGLFQSKTDSRVLFYYFNTHFSLVDAARIQSANIMLDRIAKYITLSNVPVFIGGDLNCEETSAPWGIFSHSDFEDVWAQAGKAYTNDCTCSDWNGNTGGPHIDWLFMRNEVKVNSIEVNTYNENGRYPSDHYPVQANIAIPLTGDPSPDRCSGGSVSAQHTDSPSGEEMAKAFDNSKTTKYYISHGTNVWLQYRFSNGNRFAINRYKISSANDFPERDPKSWTVAGSDDGIHWTVIDTRSNENFPLRFQTREFMCNNTTRYEYIRFEFTSKNGTSFQIAEIELYDYTNVAVSGTKTADTYNSGEEPAKGADGHVATGKWCASGPEPHWLKVDLGAVNNIYQFVVKHAASGGEAADYNTAAYQIQYSNDESNWTNAISVTGNKANITTHNINVFGRYLRLYITDAATRTGNTAARIYEFEAFGMPIGAAFYKDGGYTGTAVSLPRGNYTLAQLQEVGIANDTITSLKIVGGCTIELYEHDNFQGDVLVRTEDDPSITPEGFSDRTSSIKIY